MASIQLSDLLYEVRAAADLINDESVSDKELTLYLNKGGALLHDTLVTLYADILVQTVDLVLTASKYDTSVLPFSKVRVFARQLNGTQYIPLDRTSPSEVQPLNAAPYYWMYGHRPRYYQLGDVITVTPEDSAAGNYRLMYVPCWSNISGSFDSNDMLITGSIVNDVFTIDTSMFLSSSYTTNNWHDLAVTEAAIRARNRSDLDTTELKIQKQNIINNIETAAIERDVSGRTKATSVHAFGSLYDWDW